MEVEVVQHAHADDGVERAPLDPGAGLGGANDDLGRIADPLAAGGGVASPSCEGHELTA